MTNRPAEKAAQAAAMAAGRMQLIPLRSQPLKEQVLEQLRSLLDAGHIAPGDRLPSERELSERLQVSRSTVRETIQFLGALGLVEIRHGRGTFVRADPGNPALRDEWRTWTRRHSARVRDLIEVRRGLESLAAELAAARHTATRLRAMEEALEEMHAAADTGDVTSLVQADVRFHHAISVAAGNAALVELLDALGQQLVRERAATWDIPGRPNRSLTEHSDIYQAIRSRDGTRARVALLAHLYSIGRDIEELAQGGPRQRNRSNATRKLRTAKGMKPDK